MKTFLLSILFVSMAMVAVAENAPSVRVLVWDEQQPEQSKGYGEKFLGQTIAEHLNAQPGLTAKTVSLSSPQQGLDDATLDQTDVLIVWSHRRVFAQDDARVEAVVRHVLEGKLSLIALHSAHWSKAFVRLMQERTKIDAVAQVPEAQRASAKWEYLNDAPYTKMVGHAARITPHVEHEGDIWKVTLPQCVFPSWRADGAPSHVTTLLPKHPIAQGVPQHWDIPQTEMYSEPFHVPTPDEVVFEERWDKGEHFRSGCVWKVGKGHVFYFRPGHETFPIYRQAEPLLVLTNAVKWFASQKAH